MKNILSTLIMLLLTISCYSQKIHCEGYNKCTNAQAIEAKQERILTQSQQNIVKKNHLPYILPRSSNNEDLIILVHNDFIIGYDTILHLPLWTAYLLTANYASDELERCDCFRDDPRIYPDSDQSTCEIYEGSGYNRGHLAPRDDFNRSFLTSDI